ncbi:MAG: hypothetical protein DIJKHBIC_04764 [Thermoanaerobaculia bacterium]|nr:hypothetical protein [Thermoanaerobaculia bacterium]
MTVAVNTTFPDAFAVNVTLFVPAPAVIVPPVIAHAYVVPGPPSGTEAALPVDEKQTPPAAVITADGTGFTTNAATPVDVPPAHLLSERVTTEKLWAKVGLTWRVAGVVPAICTTPSFHLIVQGAVPVSATFIVEFVPAQTVPPPVTVAVGRGFTVTRADPLAVPAHPLAPDTAVTV